MNGLGTNGGEAIADCIKYNAAIEQLNISTNRLTTSNAFAIAQALLVNDSLHVLKVCSHRVSTGTWITMLCVYSSCFHVDGQ
jgi:hypothetical protein